MTDDLRLIHTQGLDEGIRCAMCTNTMKSDKGCDGGCVVDQKMYEKVLKVIDKALEEQPNRCDSCTHSEEQDGSNCYECIKGMADNFEEQPTDKVKCNHTTEEIAKSFIEDVEAVKDQLDGQPCKDCISRSELLRHQHIIYDDDGEDYRAVYVKDIKAMPSVAPQIEPCEDCISREAVDKLSRDLVHVTKDKTDFLCNFWEGLNALPSVYPERPKGKWIIDKGIVTVLFCSECGAGTMFKSPCCPYCGAEMSGGEEDGDSN